MAVSLPGMTHVLLAVNDPLADPRARARLGSLVRVGHRPMLVTVGPRPGRERLDVGGTRVELIRVPRGVRGSTPRLGGVLESVVPVRWQYQWTVRRVAEQVGVDPVLHVVDRRALDLAVPVARATGGVVVADPRWEVAADVDAAWSAPEHVGSSGVGRGGGPSRHVRGDEAVWQPEDGRHRGRRVGLCVRRTERTPGRYLEAALHRAGVDVVRLQDRIDWTVLPDDLDAVVIVESPLPAPEVVGTSPGVPVLFWVHHGEHHVDLNVRLAQRYDADVVLLAHSWHLAHRFPCRVERFPFAVATELGTSDTPPSSRPTDVALVGSGLGAAAAGDAYDARRALVADLRAALGDDRVVTAAGVSPEVAVGLYRSARVVPNEGGRRHRPITMRVFEAIGAGAVLACERVPGLDRLLPPDIAYLPTEDDAAGRITTLLSSPERLDQMASEATARWQARHTYDHRVDELLACVDELGSPTPVSSTWAPPNGLAGIVDTDPEVQRIVTTVPELARRLPDREVWPLDPSRLAPGSYEALVVDRDLDVLDSAVAAAWRYVYATQAIADVVAVTVEAVHETVTRTRHETADGTVHRFDLHPPSYRV